MSPVTPVRRILCPIDFSDATAAGLAPALRLVDAHDAELFLLHAVEFPYESVALERYYLDVEDAARLRLADLETDCRGDGRRTQTVVVRDGPPHDAIVSFASREGMDLIVMPTHSRHGVDRLLAGSVAERVVQSSECPVLVVPPVEAGSAALEEGHILLATDFSEHSDAALEFTAALAARLKAHLTLAHVVTLERGSHGKGWPLETLPKGLEEEVLGEARAGLVERAELLRSRVENVDVSLLRGSQPARELAGLASSLRAGLTIVASHGHSRVVNALLGSTATKLVRHAPTPVLVVRPQI